MEPLKALHAQWGDQVEFVEVMVRQAHPGPDVPPYQSFDQKLRDARRYLEEERIPWTVVVDDLEGTVHQAYGSLSDPTYIIDRSGAVSFYNMWTYAPTLHQALEALMGRGGLGVVGDGYNRRPHMQPAMTNGWRALRRGLPQSYFDMEMAAPTSAVWVWLGSKLRPVLGPLTLRSTPLPPAVRAGLALGVGALAVAGVMVAARRRAETGGRDDR